jgi:radical SAM superfamily enzyme YgiQ (UPF0313 family)
MKLKLIIPGWPKTSIWSSFVFRFPYLSVTTLAALTPAGWDVSIEDENIQPIAFDEPVDLVGITALTPLAPRAYAIAAEFRKRGVPVVMGGFHATWLPVEAGEHVDTVVVGEAEECWPKLLDDFARGEMKPLYRADDEAKSFPLVPPPRRDLLRKRGYLFHNTIQTTRGCPFGCEFCSVTQFFGRRYRTRSLDEVAHDLDTISGGADFLFIVDDNVVGNPRYAKELFELLARYPFKWLSQASITFAENDELLRLAAKSGCQGMFIGFESLDQEALERVNKSFNKVSKYADAIKKIHDHGIGIQGSFIFGYDWDTPATFDRVLEFTIANRLESVLFTVLTPFPGTEVHRRLTSEGRILSTDWALYDMAHVVYRPAQMTPEELETGYLRANREFHTVGSMFRRLPFCSRRIAVFGPMNWGFRMAWRKFSAAT